MATDSEILVSAREALYKILSGNSVKEEIEYENGKKFLVEKHNITEVELIIAKYEARVNESAAGSSFYAGCFLPRGRTAW